MARYRYVTRTLQYRALQAPPAEPLAVTKSHEQAKKKLHLSETPSNLDCGRIVQMVCDILRYFFVGESRLHSFTIWQSPMIIHKEISTSVRQVADSQRVFPAAQPQLKSRNKQSPCDPSSGKWRPDNEHKWMMLDDALQVMDIMSESPEKNNSNLFRYFEPSVPVCLRGAMSYNVVYIIYLKIGKTYYSHLFTIYLLYISHQSTPNIYNIRILCDNEI